MNTLTTTMISAALMLTALASNAQDANAQCDPTIDTMRTHFPNDAIEKRQHGVVRLSIRLDEQGNVVAARVIESSGHATLDRAATSDVRRHWRFRVAHCNASELAEERSIAVTYQRPAGLTVSGTLNRKALSRTRELHADLRCHGTRRSSDLTVFTCQQAPASSLADARR